MIYRVCRSDTHPSVRYLVRERKGEGLERICESLLESKIKPFPPKLSVKFECQIWPKITKKFAKKGLDGSSL